MPCKIIPFPITPERILQRRIRNKIKSYGFKDTDTTKMPLDAFTIEMLEGFKQRDKDVLEQQEKDNIYMTQLLTRFLENEN